MSQLFGCCCIECFDTYATETWQPPFICHVCVFNRQKADIYFHYRDFRRRWGAA